MIEVFTEWTRTNHQWTAATKSHVRCSEIHLSLLSTVVVFPFPSVASECRNVDSSQLLINGVSPFGCGLRFFEKLFEARGISALNHSEARLVAHVISNFGFWWAIVEIEWRLSL